MNTFPVLKHTPIKEIILGISYHGSVDLELLDSLKDVECFSKTFDTITPTELANINLKEDNKAETTIKREGILFENSNGKSLRFRIGSVGLHLVDQYQPLDLLISEFMQYWNAFSEITQDLAAASIFVRYLNFIPVEKKSDSISDYIKIYPNHPFHDLPSDSFCNVQFNMDEALINIVSTKGEIKDIEGVVLDYTIKKEINSDKTMLDEFNSMQIIKNKIFFASLTEKTLNLYK